MSPTLDVQAVDHVGMAVADLDEAVAVMADVFGAMVLRRGMSTPEADLSAQFEAHPDASYRVAALDVAGRMVEFFEWAAPDRNDLAPRACDVGAFHLALTVPDVDEALAALATEPRVVVMGEVQELAPPHPRAGRRWIYLRTRWGLLVELVSDPGSAS